MRTTLWIFTVALCVTFSAQSRAAIMHDLDMTVGAQTVDTTTTAYADWGYASGDLPLWTNQKAGVTPELVVSQTGLSFGTRDYGHRFTFNDGTSPASGSNVVADGNVLSLANGDALTLTFEDIVDTTEKTLTLYTGTFNSGANATFNFQSTLTGGSLDEVTGIESFGFPAASTVPGTYEVTFSSATETDLVIDISISGAGGGTRNFALSGYTLTAPPQTEVEVIPEPYSSVIWVIIGIGLCGYGLRRFNLKGRPHLPFT